MSGRGGNTNASWVFEASSSNPILKRKLFGLINVLARIKARCYYFFGYI